MRKLIYLSIEEAEEVMESIECCVEEINEKKEKDPEIFDNNEGLVSAYDSIKKQLKALQHLTRYNYV